MGDSVTHVEIDEALDALLAPTRELAARLDEQALRLTSELAAVREQQRRVQAALRALDPALQGLAKDRTKPAVSTNGKLDPAKLAVFRDFVVSNRERFADGEVLASEVKRLKAAGQTIGLGEKHFVLALAELRDEGILRADRKIRGGGIVYKFVDPT